MSRFLGYASNFEIYPTEGPAFGRLAKLFMSLDRVDFVTAVKNPNSNQGQRTSNFDVALSQRLFSMGATACAIDLPKSIPQKFDFAFSFEGCRVAVEVEKANKEKILRDVLKCHMYLHSGCDFAVIALPRNWPHKGGVERLFDFGRDRFAECAEYGFGRPELLGRILLLGYTQYDAATGKALQSRPGAPLMNGETPV